jgi:hypothetical protein
MIPTSRTASGTAQFVLKPVDRVPAGDRSTASPWLSGYRARRWNEPLRLRVRQCMGRSGLSTEEGPSEHHEGLLRQEGTDDTKSSVRVGPLPRRVHGGWVLRARTFQYPDNPQGPAKARELPRRARRRPLQLAGPDGYADRVLWRPISSQPNGFRRTAVATTGQQLISSGWSPGP